MTSENVSESLDDFNSFQYWRDPIPDFDEQDVCLTEIVRKYLIFDID